LHGETEIDCSLTTQFASGFLLSHSEYAHIIPVNMQSSEAYWNMSLDLVKSAQFNLEMNVPIDWSSASYPLAFGALNQTIHFPGLQYDPFQADSLFLKILKDFQGMSRNA
jgi:5-enolpyruvylshikimate-3-phosphate synthase